MTDSFKHDPARQARAEQFQAAALKLEANALQVEEIALLLNDDAENCSCCGGTRYRHWPQHQVRQQVSGAAERLRSIAANLRRRAHDPEFQGEVDPLALPFA